LRGLTPGERMKKIGVEGPGTNVIILKIFFTRNKLAKNWSFWLKMQKFEYKKLLMFLLLHSIPNHAS
jgi:hypothetical protein